MEPSRQCRTCGVTLIKKPGRGRWPYWCSAKCKPRKQHRYVPVTTRHECSRCGATLRNSWLPEPVCRGCDGIIGAAESARRARRRRAQQQLTKAAAGTTSKRVWTQGCCNWCGDTFTSVSTRAARWCSEGCCRRAKKRRRVTTQHGGTGWRWSNFMRMAAKFGYCCAYCGTKPDRLDPDHVVPLARGGDDSLSNLLPTCLACNSDKRDLLLDEWNEDRARRHLPPRLLNLNSPRYHHLALRTVAPRATHAA